MAYNPAFSLKRISHQEVLDDYINGKFVSINIGKSIKISSQSEIVCKEFATDPNYEMFTYGLSKYSNPVYVSSNQKAFDTYFINGSLARDLDCDWCHQHFPGEPTGMVVAYKKTYLTNPDTGENHLYEVFWLYGNHCSDECALGELIYTRRIGSTNSNLDCHSAITYTGILFTKKTGKDITELVPTPYFRLLKSRGGTLERKDGNGYIQNSNIILAPAKMVFEKIS